MDESRAFSSRPELQVPVFVYRNLIQVFLSARLGQNIWNLCPRNIDTMECAREDITFKIVKGRKTAKKFLVRIGFYSWSI